MIQCGRPWVSENPGRDHTAQGTAHFPDKVRGKFVGETCVTGFGSFPIWIIPSVDNPAWPL